MRHFNIKPEILTIEKLEIIRGENLLISGLCADVRPGDVLWIQGTNGIGKTSLLKAIAGLARPDGGKILWGESPADTHGFDFVAYQGHHDSHKSDLTAQENLEFWQSIFNTRTDISNLLERVNITHLANNRVKTFSAGQSRRLALARMLLKNAPLWIMDEPTAAMDQAGQDLVTGLVDQHVKRGGAVIIASHGAPEKIGQNTRILTIEGQST